MIYFLRAGSDGPVKIGRTKDRRTLKQRLATLQEPSRSNSLALHLRLPPDLRGEIERAAETEERSFPQMLRLLVKRGLGSSASKPTDKAA